MRIEINGTSIEVAEQGTGDPVVLLHCSGSSGAQWRALAATLVSRYHVLAPDFIGYGGSSQWACVAPFRLAHEAAVVRSLLGRLGQPAHLIGHSYGGAVALHIARTRLELLRSLVLIEPSAFHLLRNGDTTDATGFREITAVAADARASLESGDLSGGLGRFVDYWSGPDSWAAMPPDKRTAFAPQLRKIALDFDALLGEPTELEDVRGIALPTLLLQGERTKLPSRCVVRRLRDALPTAVFKLVHGAGHMLPITHREEVNRLIAAHIENVSQHRRMEWKALQRKERTNGTLSA
jgi:pimeloyl-ACP methyl ester carboxylesterase